MTVPQQPRDEEDEEEAKEISQQNNEESGPGNLARALARLSFSRHVLLVAQRQDVKWNYSRGEKTYLSFSTVDGV